MVRDEGSRRSKAIKQEQDEEQQQEEETKLRTGEKRILIAESKNAQLEKKVESY